MRSAKIFITLLLCASASMREDSFAEAKPNIICVFIDDMGYSDFSCFGGKVKTQHIDQLAAEGIKFTNFYVNSPICSPSRVALTTGQYPYRYRITSFLNNRNSNKKRGMAQWLDPKAPTLARELQKNSYNTGHFGKWHMGGQRDVDDAPPITAYGFEQSLTNFEGMGPKLLPLTLKPGQDPTNPGRIWANAERLGDGFRWMQRSEITTGFVNAALTFIETSQTEEKPFFINLWPDDVHGPFWPPLDKWGGDKRALYQGVLDSMDEQLGRLFDKVRNDPKLRDNTIITVCSDNGHEPGAGTSKPFRGAKTWLYEGGIRSPLVVWAPGLIPQEKSGTTNDESVFSAIDLNRSLYQITGIEPSEELDGEDLSSTVLGKSKQSRTAPICWRRPPDRPGHSHGFDEDNPDLAIRDGKWKYLVNHDGSAPQLYDLPSDPSESRNLAEQNPDITSRLDKALRAWNATMPKDAGSPKLQANKKKPKPNFVFIITDDISPDDLSIYGNDFVKTPNLTRIAKRGLVFDNAYLTISSCSPSRCSIITGRYPHNTGAPELHTRLPKNQKTFVQALRNAGYHTAISGKNHMGKAKQIGFEEESNSKPAGAEKWVDQLRQRPKDKPFFLWLASHDAHYGWQLNDKAPTYDPKKVKVPPFLVDGPGTRDELAKYYHEVSRTDHYAGEVMNELKAQGIADNTYFIYCSDNGRPFPRCKTYLYDSGIKSPLLVVGPGVKTGRTSSITSSIDYAATILDLAGIKQLPTIQGASFQKVLRDPTATTRDVAFAERNWHVYQNHARAVRTGDWLYIWNAFPERHNVAGESSNYIYPAVRDIWEAAKLGTLTPAQELLTLPKQPAEMLFNVKTDPHQLNNLSLSAENDEVLKQMRAHLADWTQQTGDSVPKTPTPDRQPLHKKGGPNPKRVEFPGAANNATEINHPGPVILKK